MNSEERLIWFKGKILPVTQAKVQVMSPMAQFGLNVFEGIRGYWDGQDIQIFRFHDHMKRLMESCRLIGIICPYKADDIAAFSRKVLSANNYRCDVALRTTVFVEGEGSWSSSEPVDMFIAPIAKQRNNLDEKNQNHACISTWIRIDDNTLPPRVKLGANYLNGRYAHLEAKRNGYDLPILLNSDGSVAEGAGACLFLRRGNRLITPDISSSILESITRDTLITIAHEMGITVETRKVNRTELYVADELFFCGSAAEITPLTSIDKFIIGDGTPGTLTLKLHDAYLRAADGRDIVFSNWRMPVYNIK